MAAPRVGRWAPAGAAAGYPRGVAPAAPDCVGRDVSACVFSCIIAFPNVLKLPLLRTVGTDQVCVGVCQINCLSPPPTGDDCEGKKLLETHADIRLRSSRPERVAGALWPVFSYAGCLSHLLFCSYRVLRKRRGSLFVCVVKTDRKSTGFSLKYRERLCRKAPLGRVECRPNV